MYLAKPAVTLMSWLVAASVFGMAHSASADDLIAYEITGDAIARPLTDMAGDAAAGRTVVLNRANTCLLCHGGPFPDVKFQGDLAPGLGGTGSRWSAGQLRLRLVDASRLNPATIMPSYYRVDHLQRVGAAWQGKPILTAQQIEDVVAFLGTLRDPS